MKYLLFIPFAILIGLAAGSWAPRNELIQLRNEIQELKQDLKANNRSGKLSVLGNLIKVPEKKSKRKPKHFSQTVESSNTSSTAAISTETNINNEAVSTNTPTSRRKRRERQFPDPKSETYEADLEEAKELWETRVELARAQWLSKMKLNDEEIDLFDQAIADMNDKLFLTMQVTAEELQNTDSMSAEAGLRIMNSVTETLVDTYDQIGDIVPEDQRSEVEKMEIPDFIDPASFEPLIDVRDKL